MNFLGTKETAVNKRNRVFTLLGVTVQFGETKKFVICQVAVKWRYEDKYSRRRAMLFLVQW